MRFISASFTRSSSFYARISGSESGSLISSSFIVTTANDLGGFEADFDNKKVTFVIPSASAGGSADVKALMISASGINPRIGIGVDNPLKAFDFKEVSDTTRGGELLIRGSRTTIGAQAGDEAGRINFIIDSSSYTKVETSGSVAEVVAIVDEVDQTGVLGSLSFRVSAQKDGDSIEKLRITSNGTKVTGSFTVSGSNSFINIGPAEFTGSVSITDTLEVDGTSTFNGITTHNSNVIISNGYLDANDDGIMVRGTAGLSVGDAAIPGVGRLRVTDYSNLLGGVHVGGTTDPGTDNLLVDGTTTLVGDTIISGSNLYFPNLTAGSAGNYDKLLIIDSSGQARTLAKSSVPYIEVFDGAVPTNQTLVMFSGSTGDVANATGVSYNSAFGWTFTSAGSVYDVTIGNGAITSLTAVTGSFTGDISATNGSFSGDLTVDGNITANQYIVSSSVTYLTQSFSSGSTIFGDTPDDTHQFTGSVSVTNSLNVVGDITGSGRFNLNNGSNSIIIGKNAVNSNPSPSSVFIGYGARSNSTAGNSVAIGQDAEAGYNNVAVGKSAEANGAYTVSLGWYANEGGSSANSVYIGYNTGRQVTGTNVAVGGRSLYVTNGTGNAILGTQAFDGGGSNNDNNTVLGHNAGLNGSGNVLIGKDAGSTQSLTNKLYIENSDSTTPLIYGEFDNDLVRINGKLYVSNSLDITGSVSASTYYGDGSNLTGIDSGSWDGIFTGSAEITGSTTVIGDITTNTISTISTTLASDSATNVDTFNTSSYTGAIYDYVLIDTTVGARAGQFMIAQDNGSVTFTDNSTRHLFDTTEPEISGQINGSNVEVQVTNGNGYTFKSFVKKL